MCTKCRAYHPRRRLCAITSKMSMAHIVIAVIRLHGATVRAEGFPVVSKTYGTLVSLGKGTR